MTHSYNEVEYSKSLCSDTEYTHAISNHPPHMMNSPSAFIPFCDFNADMLAVGEHIDNFPFPVCNAFTPSHINGQLCYMFDPSTIHSNITYDNPYLTFLLDYNEDREYPAYKTDMGEHENEPKNLDDLMENEERNKE